MCISMTAFLCNISYLILMIMAQCISNKLPLFDQNPIINFSSSALYHTTRRLTVQQRTITIEERISNREKSSASLDPCSHRARDRDLTPSSSFRPSPAAPWIRLENTRNCVGCKNEKNNENVPKYTKKL